MNSGNSAHSTFDRHEPIPGYRTTELLGRGGYGEVWKAIAPGGIAKAIKIIYGDADPTKAESELRALARIKDVRHPLLLSIERIEMSCGNLVIVTELADGSLKDRFLQLRQAQAVGVPQDELLRYISDAAEALDYLYESYSLQHLDVKPENILLLSRRGKLGDFGLVKNLYERSASLVGGLTPTYAPPELFEGKPNRHSDQYGLAIVYAHMLTGMLPFPSGTTAQLAAAHLRGVPDLTALPRSQRPVIARALSKDPAQRFPNCVALMAALRDAMRESEPAVGATPAQPWKAVVAPAPLVPATAAAGVDVTTPRTQVLPAKPQLTPTRPLVAADTTPAMARATTVAPIPAQGAPTVIIGVGGMGVEVLGRLVDRLNDRFGPAAQWPPLELIVVDSHTRSLTSRFREQDLDRVHVVAIPLKPADAYGSQANEHLRWLGRRWFYNIPRDLTTNGFRPLGRLALVSNGTRVRAALTKVLGTAARQAISTGLLPRVSIIGGIGGGTGSGIIPDLAYATRSELKRQGMPHERLRGILMHATPRSHAERDKSRANGYALLRELHHYSAPGGNYPGESHLDAFPFHGDNAAFSETLLFQLGESLTSTEWELGLEQTAEYLFAAHFTRASECLDPRPEDTNNGEAPLKARRAQVVALGAGGSSLIGDALQLATDDVLQFWREGRRAPPADTTTEHSKTLKLAPLAPVQDLDSPIIDAAVRKQFQEAQLDVARLTADALEVLCLETGGTLEQFHTQLISQAIAVAADANGVTARAQSILTIIDRCLQSGFNEEVDEVGDDQLFLQIASRVAVRANAGVKRLFDWILQKIDQPEERLAGARRYVMSMQRHLQNLQLDALKQAQSEADKAEALAKSMRSEDFYRPEIRSFKIILRQISPDQKLRDHLPAYSKVRLQEFALRVAAKIARIIDAECTTTIEQLDRLARDLGRLTTAPATSPARTSQDEATVQESSAIVMAYRRMLRDQLQRRRFDIARAIDEATQAELAAAQKPLRSFLDPLGDLHEAFYQPLRRCARRCLLDAVQDVNRQLLNPSATSVDQSLISDVVRLLREQLASDADPSEPMSNCLVIPQGTDPGALGDLSSRAAVVEGPLIDITLCRVGQAVTLGVLAEELTDGVQMYRDLGERLMSRVDLKWRSLADSTPESQGTASFPAVSEIERTAALPGLAP